MELPFDLTSCQVSSTILSKYKIWNKKFSKNYLLAPTWREGRSGFFGYHNSCSTKKKFLLHFSKTPGWQKQFQTDQSFGIISSVFTLHTKICHLHGLRMNNWNTLLNLSLWNSFPQFFCLNVLRKCYIWQMLIFFKKVYYKFLSKPWL